MRRYRLTTTYDKIKNITTYIIYFGPSLSETRTYIKNKNMLCLDNLSEHHRFSQELKDKHGY